MKPWYQYLCEGISLKFSEDMPYFFQDNRMSKRLSRFLFRKAAFGGLPWVFTYMVSDWRSIYGCVGN